MLDRNILDAFNPKEFSVSTFLISSLCFILILSSLFIPFSDLLAPVLVSSIILLIVLLLSYSAGDAHIIKTSTAWIMLSVSLLMAAIFGEEHFKNKSISSFLSNFAAVFVSLGLINIILQLKDTKDYFANALSELVMGESYISKLSRSQLEILQKRVLQKYFENSTEFDRENSFYRYFSNDLQKYIGAPYRENYVNTVAISQEDGAEGYKVKDCVSYSARSMGGRIQDEVVWRTAPNEVRDLKRFRLLLDKKIVFEFGNPDHSNREGIEHTLGGDVEKNGIDFKCSLAEYEKHERLQVEIEAEYFVSDYRSITLKVVFPTFGFTVILNHSSSLKSRVEVYGFDQKSVDAQHTSTEHGMTLGYRNWLLPHSGLYIDIQPSGCQGCVIKQFDPSKPSKTETKQQG